MGSQTFLPIHNIDWTVVVASDKDGSPDISSIKCFIVKGTQGISYKPYTWHFPLLVDREQDFWVIDSLFFAFSKDLKLFFLKQLTEWRVS